MKRHVISASFYESEGGKKREKANKSFTIELIHSRYPTGCGDCVSQGGCEQTEDESFSSWAEYLNFSRPRCWDLPISPGVSVRQQGRQQWYQRRSAPGIQRPY
jgi:hypothetical protein